MDFGGVVVFFAIRGFITPTSPNHHSLHPVRKSLISRLFRLCPLCWVSTITRRAVSHPTPLPYTIVDDFTMVQAFLLVPHITGAAWTLAIELICYVISFVLFMSGRLHERRAQFGLLVGMTTLLGSTSGSLTTKGTLVSRFVEASDAIRSQPLERPRIAAQRTQLSLIRGACDAVL